MGRKNDLFVGSQTEGKSGASACTLIEIGKLNVDPNRRLAYTLACISDDIINKVGHLLPWR